MPYVLEPQQIIDGFDISALGCKVVSVTILSMRMTHLFVNLGLIWRELGQQFCANPPISPWRAPAGRRDHGDPAPPPSPLRGSRGVQSAGKF